MSISLLESKILDMNHELVAALERKSKDQERWLEALMNHILTYPEHREDCFALAFSAGNEFPSDFSDPDHFSLKVPESKLLDILEAWGEAAVGEGSPAALRELQKYAANPSEKFVPRSSSRFSNSIARALYSLLWQGFPKVPGNSTESRSMINLIYRFSEYESPWQNMAKDWLKIYSWLRPEWTTPSALGVSMEDFIKANSTLLAEMNVTIEESAGGSPLSSIVISGKEKVLVSFACEENHLEERKAAGVVTAVNRKTLSCKCEGVSSSAIEEQVNWYLDCAQSFNSSLTYNRQVTLPGQEHRPYDGGLSVNGELQSVIEVNGGDHYRPRTSSEKAETLFARRVTSDSQKALAALESGLTLVAIDVRDLTRANGRKLIQAVLNKVIAGEVSGLVTVGELTPGLKAINWAGTHHAF